jgi:tetratricopeptide (TPR) repeat protein
VACKCGASLQYSWIEDPITLLSNYLASDATLRKIAGATPIHERNHPRLAQQEAVRRRAAVPVNPVPGIAELGDDVFADLEAIPDDSFATLLRQGIEARKLEREAQDLEMEEKIYEAIDAYNRALELNPRDGSVRRSMASLRTRMGIRYVADRSFTAAHQNLRAAVETDTTYAHGFANLGSLLLYTGPPDYAIATAHQATLLEPDDDLSWALLGHIRRKQGNLPEAVPYYEKALELNPQNLDAAMAYVDTKMELDVDPDIAEAVHYLESFLVLEPDNEELLYRIGKYRDALRRGYISDPEIPDTTFTGP